MKFHAFAALLALPLLALAAPTAKADRYCCGGDYKAEFVTRDFYVTEHATVYGCDGYHCQTALILKSDTYVKARCRNGWCQIRSTPFKNAWVLETCLKDVHHKAHGGYPQSKSHAPEYEAEPDGYDDKPEDYDDKPEHGYQPEHSYKPEHGYKQEHSYKPKPAYGHRAPYRRY
jgi:hypothetical protein